MKFLKRRVKFKGGHSLRQRNKKIDYQDNDELFGDSYANGRIKPPSGTYEEIEENEPLDFEPQLTLEQSKTNMMNKMENAQRAGNILRLDARRRDRRMAEEPRMKGRIHREWEKTDNLPQSSSDEIFRRYSYEETHLKDILGGREEKKLIN